MDPRYLPIPHGETDEIREISGIPFSVRRDKNGLPESFGYGMHRVPENNGADELYLSGMVTQSAGCSEWWGPNEGCFNQGERAFLGDCLGYLHVIYTDHTMDIIPLIFGVDLFHYELFHEPREEEWPLTRYKAPYDEPFRSDPTAGKLLDESLLLNVTGEGKGFCYILAVRLGGKPVQKLEIVRHPAKLPGIYISAATLLKHGECPASLPKKIAPALFFHDGWRGALNRLAHRLYQFKEDIPDIIPAVPSPQGAPVVTFTGSRAAQVLTNVYRENIRDMMENKLTADGRPHTSSKASPNFGCYVGFGTYRENVGEYYDHMWTRDVGRALTELAFAGCRDRLRAAADVLHSFLDTRASKYERPNWKRMANLCELSEELVDALGGKENDGHAAVMLYISQLWRIGVVDRVWLEENRQHIEDAADWFVWQMDHPERSNFKKVLYSETEAATQYYGAYDLFSNTLACYALMMYAQMTAALGWQKSAVYAEYGKRLEQGISEVFLTEDDKFGLIACDNIYDGWTYRYKRFAPAFVCADVLGYDLKRVSGELFTLMENTYHAQKEEYFHPYSGRQMGYGQGYLTQTALLLDQVEDYTACLEGCGFLCYHAHDYNYIVPEGVIMHPSGRYWFRNADLGNGVQQAEIIKCIRLMVGVDDFSREGLRFVTRMPSDFECIAVNGLGVQLDGRRGKIDYCYRRTENGYMVSIAAQEPARVDSIRIGPFDSDRLIVPEEYPVTVERTAGHYYAQVQIGRETGRLELAVSLSHKN